MKYASLLLLLLFVFSCENKIKVLNYEVPKDIEIHTLPITFNVEKNLLYSNLYSKIDYIQLETTEQSLVSTISKLVITDDGNLIVLDKNIGSVIRFDNKGKYICNIGKLGNGHGEYISPYDVVFDKYNNCIIVLDGGSAKLNYYDLSGKFLSSTRLESYPRVFTVLDENYLCLYVNNYDNLEKHSVGHNIKIINRKGLVVSEFLEFDETMASFHPACDDVFFSIDSKTCFRQPLSSLVYSVDNEEKGGLKITPELYIDFGDKRIPQEWFQGDDWNLIKKLKKSNGIAYIISMYKIKNRIFLNILKGDVLCLYILNIEDRSQDKLFLSAYNDMLGFVAAMTLSTIKDNRCYYIINPSDFDEYREQFDNKKTKFYLYDENYNEKEYIPSQLDKMVLDSIQEDGNPIIQVCTLKD